MALRSKKKPSRTCIYLVCLDDLVDQRLNGHVDGLASCQLDVSLGPHHPALPLGLTRGIAWWDVPASTHCKFSTWQAVHSRGGDDGQIVAAPQPLEVPLEA